MTCPTPAEAIPRLKAFAERWAGNTANERAIFQSWFNDFCDALGVPKPVPPTDDHRFELPIQVVNGDGTTTTNYIDYWKAGHVAVEAKASRTAGGPEVRSGGADPDRFLRRAFGQVRNYVAHVSGTPPPYLVAVDVPKSLIVWDRWSGNYGDFPAGRRIGLATLHERPDDIALLQDILSTPQARDPRARAQTVTKEIAGKLAELAAAFEGRGEEPERVARFLMRCVFCFFAEDVGLLPTNLFSKTLAYACERGPPQHVGEVLTRFWRTMDRGGDFGPDLLHRFNGRFFQTIEALALTPEDVGLLIEASGFDWAGVEPSIFGTLLVRALDPEERHRLGAEYTPREFIERLVEPTVVEPIRERWTAVQVAVLQMEDVAPGRGKGKKKSGDGAKKLLLDFHMWLRSLSFLDPACGSGNFLYVTMAAVKRIELEVFRELERVAGKEQTEAILEEVHPRQFHGIEVKPWAREIAELTLWIGYHQFWRQSHGGRTPPDPILEDTGTIECRDAVLAWDEIVHRPEKDRPDPTPRILHPVTGELVPDPEKKLPYYEYVGARPAEWPRADFIVGNPPYLGKHKRREALGDGYLTALWEAYPDIKRSADFVMFWWVRAAQAVGSGATTRAGLITTNSLTQPFNRHEIERARDLGVAVVWAIPDHPWTDEADGAAVRVAMTVLQLEPGHAIHGTIDDSTATLRLRRVAALNSDLSIGVDAAAASNVALSASKGISGMGFALYGDGFIIERNEAETWRARDPRLKGILRPYRNGKDLVDRPRGVFVIDFGIMTEAEARTFSIPYQRVADTVKPHRAANARESIRRLWWQFGWPRPELRDALEGLERYVATPETSKHRFFMFLDAEIAPDNRLVCIATDQAWHLAVLSSRLHLAWALAAGGTLEDRPIYSKRRTFEAYPFPYPSLELVHRLGSAAESLDAHRKEALARDERITMTGMYNVVAKLRSGEQLTAKERSLHEVAACGVLKDLHDELDALVAQAYGWPWPMEKEEILERLVKLHDERVEEEKRGLVRWLRPEYQIPRFGGGRAEAAPVLDIPAPEVAVLAEPARQAWPATGVEQIAALGALLGQRAITVAEAVETFEAADRKLVERHLETLALIGEATVDGTGRYRKLLGVG